MRAAIYRAFQSEPDVLLLDEPFSRLDDSGSEILQDMLMKRKNTGMGVTLIAEHRTEFLTDSLADKILPLQPESRGELYSGSFRDILPQKNGGGVELQDSGMQFRGIRLFAGVDLHLLPGSVVGITGPNGSGKTTLGRIIAGLIKPTQGKVTRPPGMLSSLVHENPEKQLICSAVGEEIDFARRNYRLPHDYTKGLLRIFDLEHLQDSFPANLSHGQQERTALAAGLSMAPGLIVLDEPLQGQDYIFRGRLKALIEQLKAAGRIILLIGHDSEFLHSAADNVYELSNGKLEPLP